MSDHGATLRAVRENAGVSLAAMAARTHYSKALLGLLETGKRSVKPEHVEAYGRALCIPIDLILGPPTDPIRIAHEWLVSDSPAVVHTKAGRHIGAALVGEIEKRVIELRHLDDVVGGGDLFPVVNKELAELFNLVRSASYSAPIGRRLLVATGELAQLAGWVSSDARRHFEAQYTYLNGFSAAQEAGERTLAAQLLSSLSYQMANVGNPRDAALLARSAVKGATDAPPVVRALLLERSAWASARSRDRSATERTLDAVDDAYESRSPGIAEPEWVYWLNRSEIDVMAGRCLIELGKPSAAEPLLSRAIDSYDKHHSREVALYLTWLAESYAKAGVADAAKEVIARARAKAGRVNSERLNRRISEVEILPALKH